MRGIRHERSLTYHKIFSAVSSGMFVGYALAHRFVVVVVSLAFFCKGSGSRIRIRIGELVSSVRFCDLHMYICHVHVHVHVHVVHVSSAL